MSAILNPRTGRPAGGAQCLAAKLSVCESRLGSGLGRERRRRFWLILCLFFETNSCQYLFQ